MKAPIPKHILIIRLSSLGDVVLTTPCLSYFKMLSENNCFLSFLTSEENAPLLQSHKHLDDLYTLPKRELRSGFMGIKNIVSLIKKIHQKHPIDLVVDLQSNFKTILMGVYTQFVWKIPLLRPPKKAWYRRKLVWKNRLSAKIKKGVPLVRENNISLPLPFVWENYLHFLSLKFQGQVFQERDKLSRFIGRTELGVTSLGQPNQNLISLPEQVLITLAQTKVIFIMLDASYPSKSWPKSYYQQLVLDLLDSKFFNHYYFCLLGQSTSPFSVSARLIDLRGKTNLNDLIYILKTASLCVGNDTGVLHMAEALDTPVLCLFGPTSPSLGFSPHMWNSKYLHLDLGCSPCSLHGQGPCLYHKQFCFEEMSPEMVLKQMQKMLGGQT